MIWLSLLYDRPIRFGMKQCRAFITTERDGYFCGANDDIGSTFEQQLQNKTVCY